MKIATYNIHFGGKNHETQIAEVLREIDADVVILTETSDTAAVETIASKLQMNVSIAHGRKTSIAALSRSPAQNWTIYNPPELGRPLLEVSLQTTSHQRITLFGLHLSCHFFRHNERQRLRELNCYLEYIQARDCGQHIILGDFNAVAEGDRPNIDQMPLKEKAMLRWERNRLYHEAISSILEQKYVDCFRRLHPADNGFTLPVNKPNIRLDYAFASPSLAGHLRDCQVHTTPITLRASDHFPVWASFDL